MPRKDFPITKEDETKANLLLVGIISVYFVLVLVAYLCTDGRRRCIVPLLRKCWPAHPWVRAADGKLVDRESLMYTLHEELRRLNFTIRKAKRDGLLHRWKVKSGVTFVQVYEDDDFVEVNHIDDLKELGIRIS